METGDGFAGGYAGPSSDGSFFAEVNAAYFAGRLDQLSWDEELYSQWLQENNALSLVLSSVAQEKTENQTAAQWIVPSRKE